MLCLGSERTVQRDNICLRDQLLQRNILHFKLIVRIRIIGKHVHAKAVTDTDHRLPDLSGSDDPRRLLVKIHAHQTVQAHVEVSGSCVRLVGVAVDRQKQRHGKLGDRLG